MDKITTLWVSKNSWIAAWLDQNCVFFIFGNFWTCKLDYEIPYIWIFQALDTLQQISDGSLDDIDFPGVSSEIKQEEAEEFELPTDCLEVNIGKSF